MINIEQLTTIAKDATKANGVSLFDLEFNTNTLKIYIDNQAGITVKDCSNVSHYFNTLAESQGIEQNYNIEVSSPGIDRPLTKPHHFERKIGNSLKISYQQDDTTQSVVSLLKEVTSKQITLINKKNKHLDIPFEHIIKAVVNIEF